jgi:O-antigen/teichoic acid export membrane protein
MSLRSRFKWFLAPMIFQAAVSVAVLPLSTLVLGPAEYGAFAVVSAVAGFGIALATAASGMLLPAHFPTLDPKGRAGLVQALFYVAVATGAILAGAMVGFAPPLLSFLEVDYPARASVTMAAGTIVLMAPWSIAYLIVILEGRATFYSGVAIVASLASASALLGGLFAFGLRGDALYVGMFASSAVMCIGGCAVLWPYIVAGRQGGLRWIPRVLRMMLVAGIANVLENAQTLVERAVLSRWAGVAAVGLYSHAQLYRSALFGVIKAASNAVWPRSLEEARDPRGAFTVTGVAWESIYVALTIAGVFAAFIADDVIALLTHGKFSQAGPLVAGLVAVLLVQFSGKPQLALLYARDQGEYLGRLMGVCASCAMLSLLATVPLLGAWGVVASLTIQQVLYRIGVHLRARRIAAPPFQDHDVLLGVAIVLCAALLELLLQPPAWLGFVAACVGAAAVGLFRKRAIRTGLSILKASPG